MSNPQPQPHAPLLEHYAAKVADGTIRDDANQRAALEAMQPLCDQLKAASSITLSAALARLIKTEGSTAPAGAYLWGDVGRGKSMLMQLFFDAAPTPHKQRIHFHAFMRDVHARLHAWRQLKATEDLLPRVVKDMAHNLKLLCLDELQVHDVTDAMILSRLFTLLFEMGVMVVFTSNRPPEGLYQGGLQREQFDQFVALVKRRLKLIAIDSPHDYRRQQLAALERTYIWPADENAQMQLHHAYGALTLGQPSGSMQLLVQGRTLPIDKCAGGVAWMTFEELCARPLGAADYLELAALFSTIIVQDIPRLSPEKRNEAKRFVTLIDTLYEHKTKLICSAEAAPEHLYVKGDGAFEFERTVSRLIEMQSAEYLASSNGASL